MVQVENEYGAFGSGAGYLDHLAKWLIARGVDVPLFTSDNANDTMLGNGGLLGALRTASFGSRVGEGLAALRRHQQTGPLMLHGVLDLLVGPLGWAARTPHRGRRRVYFGRSACGGRVGELLHVPRWHQLRFDQWGQRQSRLPAHNHLARLCVPVPVASTKLTITGIELIGVGLVVPPGRPARR
jgi:hypothetical protein